MGAAVRGGRPARPARRSSGQPRQPDSRGRPVKPSKLLAFTLGTLSAIGGFIDIGDLVADALVGARFGLALAWVTVLSVVGIACYAEMSARITVQTRRPAFDLIRSRLGPGYALAGLLGALAVTGLLVMAELSG